MLRTGTKSETGRGILYCLWSYVLRNEQCYTISSHKYKTYQRLLANRTLIAGALNDANAAARMFELKNDAKNCQQLEWFQ